MKEQSDGARVLLETERLILRRFEPADAANLFELDNDPEVMRYLNGGIPTPREVIETEILPLFLYYDESCPQLGFLAAHEKSSPRFIGWFSFRPSHPGDPAEVRLGFRLHKEVWVRGFATEGARALIRMGFMALGVQRVVATIYEDNLASRRVLEKIGMVPVRRFRLTADDLASDVSYHSASPEMWEGDEIEYALEVSNWKRGAKAPKQ